jgi:hypothetical protein
MSKPSRRSLFFLIGLLLVAVLSFAYLQGLGPESSSEGLLTLVRPALVDTAEASGDSVLSDLADEAGISAYYKAPSNINLDLLDDAFQTVEITGTTYIIGSVDVLDYEDEFDPHVYVDETGWILAYYLKDDPVAKMADPKADTVDNTLLKEAVASIASAAGQPFGDVSYYDFRYPNATHIMFIGENDGGANNRSFTINVPSSYGYFERSFASTDSNWFYLNGTRLSGSASYAGSSAFGFISAGDFATDTTHTLSQSSADYGILVVVYVVP